MNKPRDQAIRERALDPARSFIVQAPAGSGKTELLAQRVLRLLATAGRPEEILAITFTRKAAGEMRERILDALAGAAAGHPVAAEHERTTRELARAALRRDEEAGWRLLDNPTRLRVMTIDGLNAWLVQRLPLSSGLGGSAPIADRPEDLYRDAARRALLAETNHPGRDAAEKLLAHLANRFSRAESQIANLLARRDHWLPRIGGRPGVEGDAARARLEAGLARAVSAGLAEARAALTGLEDVAGLAAAAAEELAESGRESPIAACAGLAGLPGVAPGDLPAWQGLATLLLTQAPSARKSFTVAQGMPPKRKEEKARLSRLAASLGESSPRVAALHAVRSLPSPRYAEDQWQALTALLDVLRYAALELEVIFRERRVTDYVGVARAALAALGEPDSPTDLALALDYRLRHLLVDEFQDTSESQHELLRRLTAGWSEGDGRTLFCVGDPMQSIYRFREAEVGLFLRAAKSGLGGLPLESLRLSANFRAARGVVQWVNDAFADVFPGAVDLSEGAVPFSPSDWTRSGEGTVETHWVADDGGGAEAREVADLAEQLLAGDGSVGVLVRSRSHLARVVTELRTRGLAYRGIDIQPLAATPVVQGLLALTRAIAHPCDRVAWLACLRAPWCGLPLSALETLARDAPVIRALADPRWRSALDTDEEAMLSERVLPVLQAATRARGRLPLTQVVRSAWLALGGPAGDSGGACLEDAETFFEFLDAACEGGDLADPLELERRLGDLYAAPDRAADGRLEIMTIHKAKGLEFDHVILPGLNRGVRNEEAPLIRWLDRVSDDGVDLLLAPIGTRADGADRMHDFLSTLERRRAAHERVRLLYVAATRARLSLHLVATARVNADGEWAAPPRGSFLDLLGRSVGAPAGLPETAGDPAPRPGGPGLARLPLAWRPPPPPPGLAIASGTRADLEAAPEFDWAGRIARAIGIVVHRLIEQAGARGMAVPAIEATGNSEDLVRVLLAEQGLTAEETESAAREVLAALAGFGSDPRAAWIFDPGHIRREHEYAITTADGAGFRRLVLDCLLVDRDGTLWIIDFKTGRHLGGDPEGFLDRERERYQPQLETYARAVEAGHDGPIRLGLYYPLLPGWREWGWRD